MRRTKTILIQLLLVPALVLLSRPLFAETAFLFGKIGDLPVAASLERYDGSLSGWYFYNSNARQIRLEGKVDGNGAFQMEESVDGKKTGIFNGTVKDKSWIGTWQKPAGGNPLSLSLTENRNPLKDWSGEFSGTARERDAKSGYTYKWEFKLRIVNGAVKKFSSTQGFAGDDKDEQFCSIDSKDLKQVPSEAGILLQAKGDESNDDEPECAIRIMKEGDLIWIRFEDGAEEGNNCRGIGSTMFCAPRAFWNALIYDGRTQKLKGVK